MIGPIPKLKITSQCRGRQRGGRLRHLSGSGGAVAAPAPDRLMGITYDTGALIAADRACRIWACHRALLGAA